MAVDVLAHEEPKRDRDVATTLTAWCRRVTEDVVHDFPNNGWRAFILLRSPIPLDAPLPSVTRSRSYDPDRSARISNFLAAPHLF